MHETIRNQVEQDGYAILDDFLSPAECDDMLQAGLEFTKNIPSKEDRIIFSTVDAEQSQLKDDYFLKSNDNISYFFEESAVGPDGELTVDPTISLNKVGHALHLQHPIFRCYTYCDRVQKVTRELGFREPAVVQSMYIYKNPGIGGEVTPHQDITYLHTEPVAPIGFWIALEDATIQNGCLWVVPGSHKSGVHRRLVRNPDKSSKETLIYDRSAPIYPSSSFTPVPVSKEQIISSTRTHFTEQSPKKTSITNGLTGAGRKLQPDIEILQSTCILLHGNVVHKSAHNKSDKSRHAYTFHVVERENNKYSEDNWLQEGENAPFVNMYTTRQIV